MVQRLHGDGARAHVEERIAALTTAGDIGGVRRWRELQARLAQLTPPASRQ